MTIAVAVAAEAATEATKQEDDEDGSKLRSGRLLNNSYENIGRSLGRAANYDAPRRVLNQMRRGSVSAIALLLCLLVVGQSGALA